MVDLLGAGHRDPLSSGSHVRQLPKEVGVDVLDTTHPHLRRKQGMFTNLDSVTHGLKKIKSFVIKIYCQDFSPKRISSPQKCLAILHR